MPEREDDSVDGLSAAGRQMLDLKDDVLAEWADQVRQAVPPARAIAFPILIDTLPVFYANLARAISGEPGQPRFADTSSLAIEHGGERARMTGYDHESLIAEYQVFRAVIFEILSRHGVVLTHLEASIIHGSIDAGIKQSVNGFSQVHSLMRERFAAALTHDLRGPLSTIATALELIGQSDNVDKIRNYAGKSQASVARMDTMISELLDTMIFQDSVSLSLDILEFDLFDVLKEIESDKSQVYGTRIVLIGQPVRGWLDRAAFKRAIENMVTNALKYGLPGGPVTIRLEEIYDRVAVSVHNEGEPIPPDEQECIFQMYRRAQAAQKGDRAGWGVGLPYVRAIAESHGGSIGIDSTREHGTIFVFDVPRDGRHFAGAPTIVM